MSETPNTEKIMGVRVKQEGPYGPLEFVLEEIPREALAEMTRRQLKPILDIDEAKKREKQFMLISDFATKNANGR